MRARGWPPAKTALERSLREVLQLGHDYIGTEHVLLGLTGEDDGIAAQVLTRLGADLNRVRQQVIRLVGDVGPEQARPGAPSARRTAGAVQARLDAIEGRLAALERRVGTGPDTVGLDQQIASVRAGKEAAIEAGDYERAASLRDRGKDLLAARSARQDEWGSARPALPSLAEQCQELSREIDRLRALLSQHGIGPQDESA